MSQSIWTQCGAASNLQAYERDAWRVVQSQQLVGTRKLVDSEDEHELLEHLIDGAKPPVSRGPGFEGLHYLLSTSFRYPPLRYGSRFGTRADPGIWYGGEDLHTVLAEVAYYRLVFLDGSAADMTPLMVELWAFQASIRTERAIDLTGDAFREFHAALFSKVVYDAPQALGHDMRDDDVVLFRYQSARDPRGGANLGVFSPTAFAAKVPFNFKTWHCVVMRDAVEFSRKDFMEKERTQFERTTFEVDGRIPAPAT